MRRAGSRKLSGQAPEVAGTLCWPERTHRLGLCPLPSRFVGPREHYVQDRSQTHPRGCVGTSGPLSVQPKPKIAAMPLPVLLKRLS